MIVSNSTLSLALAAPMSLRHPNPNLLRRSPTISAYQRPGSQMVAEPNVPNLSFECEGIKDRIRKAFDKIELSVSSYDTAWVAMVPSLDSSTTPCFPECVTWLLDNQLPDGSWGLPHHDPLLTKDVLLSTLASVLALKCWGVGQEQMNKGLRFIELNYAYVSDEKQHTPIGFDIIFPGMIERAIDLDLSLPLSSAETHAMLQRRDMELKRINSAGGKEYLAYVSEGLGKLQDWETIMKYQRKNGSLFNSPSTTAAALTNLKDGGCLRYIRSLLQKFGHAVPTSYPLDIYARLCMVENLERLGIERHFRDEIRRVLDETYRCWLQGEEEIFLDTTTFAMAFRILRANGYDVSSDLLSQFVEEGHFFNSLSGYLKDKGAALELYKASEMIIHPDEVFLDRNRMWISNFLKQESSNGSMMADRLGKQISLEINNAIEFPHYATLERLGNRRAVEHFNVNDTRVLKTSYRSYNVGNEDFLKLAVEDFNMCQSIHQKELKCLERWIVDNRLDKLNFARQKLAYCYFSAGATLFSPELSDARVSWAKNGVLTTVVDDFFDVGGSEEELVNLIQLVEKWDVNLNDDCCSEQVEIVFLALRSTIHELGEKAYTWQGRSVTGHIIEIWLNLMKSMLRENEWSRNKSVPTIDEYMTNAYVSFALGPIVLPALYFVGPQLSKEVVESPEYHDLYELMSTCGRYLNDIRGYKRESAEGKLNAVSLHMIHDSVTEEEAVKDIKTRIDSKRRELLRLVVQEKGSVVPRACKDLFWKMCKVVHLFYAKDDGFTAHDMYAAVNAVISEPLVLNKTS